VACMNDRRSADKVLVGRPESKCYLEDLGVDGKIILKRIFEKWNGSMDWIYPAQDRDR